jgi:oligopeptide transport system substrate-binding protein
MFAAVLSIVGMVLSACATPSAPPTQAPPVIVTVVQQGTPQIVLITPTPQPPAPRPAGPKVLRFSTGIPSDVPTIDPAVAVDVISIQVIEETTVGLTRLRETDGAIQPGLATKWDVSADGKTYTFTIRDDVPWVKWDNAKQQVVKIQTCPDADGKTTDRMVTAKDFEYGILRTIAPATASDYAYVLGIAIKGANDYNSSTITDTAQVGVKAIDDKTLQLEFNEPAVYNLNIAGMWVAHAQPSWLIDGDDCTQAKGDRWTETGAFQGYGPFTLKEWVHDSTLTIVKNPFWPGSDVVPVSKIEEVTWRMLDASPTFSEFEAGNLDSAGIPLAETDRVRADPKYQPYIEDTASTPGTESYAFNTQLAPTDDVRVRQALSYAIDRKALIDNVNKGQGVPAQWFCRPGVTGCPTLDKYPDLGVKYDPAKAKALLDDYLKEKGLTADKLNLTLMFNTSESHKKRAEAIQAMWKDTLGVNVQLLNQEQKVYLVQRKEGKENIYRISWVMDYPDANNFDREVFAAGQGAFSGIVHWQDPNYDKLVLDAAKETDPAKRTQLYADADKILVVDDAVLAPLYWYSSPTVYNPNVMHPVSITGYDYYEKWDLKQ